MTARALDHERAAMLIKALDSDFAALQRQLLALVARYDFGSLQQKLAELEAEMGTATDLPLKN